MFAVTADTNWISDDDNDNHHNIITVFNNTGLSVH